MASSEFQEVNPDMLDILGLIGRGAFGAVYWAKHTDWQTEVAVKLCETPNSGQSERQSILSEARKISKANHKHIVRLYGITLSSKLCGLVIEYMENGSLERLLRNLKAEVEIPWPLRWRFVHEICSGMNILHTLSPVKVFHLDLKAGNILLDEHLSVKITDFGLSKLRTSHSTGCVAGGPGGTITHFPPEHLDNINLPVTEKFDVYSFGIVIWEILSREEVYKNAHYSEVIAIAVRNPSNSRPDLNDIPSDLPDDMKQKLVPLMKQCWDPDPQKRPYFKDMSETLSSKYKSYKAEIRKATSKVLDEMGKAGKLEIELSEQFKQVLKLDDAVKHTQEKFGSMYKPSTRTSVSHHNPTQAIDGASGGDFRMNQLRQVKEETDAASLPAYGVAGTTSPANQGTPGNPQYRYVYPSMQQQPLPMTAQIAPQQMQVPLGYPVHAGDVYNIYGAPVHQQVMRSPIPVSEPQPPANPADPNKTVTPKDLIAISKALGSHWKNLGRTLGFTDPQIDTIEIDHFHYGCQEQGYQMMYRWYQKTGSGATHGKLAEALNAIDRPDLVRVGLM
ncbi:receptor-interacting serine/threonine-protein kinase 3-like [Ptychodera flava]|uniref:receptor-interacting serine/threonine-protein kinase 3-like n=1 Tax=Ptychodera flava TaxID=63121 RepID=UPI00396A5B88